MKITTNMYVTLSYDLTVGEGDEKELMEQTTVEEPLEFIFGNNMMLDSFEKEIEGLGEGDEFSFNIAPEEAYGEYDDTMVLDLPKNIFEIDGKIDDEVLIEGNTVPMMDNQGNRLMGSVVAVKDESVTMDFNHPLAGEQMFFAGKVISVREASAQEIAALFSSQSGGGCSGCSSGNCGDC